jgi:hypothetical protein
MRNLVAIGAETTWIMLNKSLSKRLTPPICKTQPYAKKDRVEPELLAEVEYRAKSAEGKVRHPFLRGLRETFETRHLFSRESIKLGQTIAYIVPRCFRTREDMSGWSNRGTID